MEIPYDPAVPVLAVDPKEMKSGPGRALCSPVITAGLVPRAKIWKEPKCLSRDDRCHQITGALVSLEQEGHPAFCHNVDGTDAK